MTLSLEKSDPKVCCAVGGAGRVVAVARAGSLFPAPEPGALIVECQRQAASALRVEDMLDPESMQRRGPILDRGVVICVVEALVLYFPARQNLASRAGTVAFRMPRTGLVACKRPGNV